MQRCVICDERPATATLEIAGEKLPVCQTCGLATIDAKLYGVKEQGR